MRCSADGGGAPVIRGGLLAACLLLMLGWVLLVALPTGGTEGWFGMSSDGQPVDLGDFGLSLLAAQARELTAEIRELQAEWKRIKEPFLEASWRVVASPPPGWQGGGRLPPPGWPGGR